MGLQRVGHDLATEHTVKTFVIFKILPGNVLSHIYNFIKNVASLCYYITFCESVIFFFFFFSVFNNVLNVQPLFIISLSLFWLLLATSPKVSVLGFCYGNNRYQLFYCLFIFHCGWPLSLCGLRLVVKSGGWSLVAVPRLLIVIASFVAENRL